MIFFVIKFKFMFMKEPRFEEIATRNIIEKFDAENPPSLKDMDEALLALLEVKSDVNHLEYDEKALVFASALDATKITCNEGEYHLVLPKKFNELLEVYEENTVTFEIEDGYISLQTALDLNYKKGVLILPYVKDIDSLFANNVDTLYLPHAEGAWEIKVNKAAIFKAPYLTSIDYNLEMQSVQYADLRMLESIEGVMSLPSWKDVQNMQFVFPQAPILLNGISFDASHEPIDYQEPFHSKNGLLSIPIEKDTGLSQLVDAFEFELAAAQLNIEEHRYYVFAPESTSFGICNSTSCMKPGKPMFLHMAKNNSFGEVCEYLQVMIVDKINKCLEPGAIAIFPVKNISLIDKTKIIHTEQAKDYADTTFDLAIQRSQLSVKLEKEVNSDEKTLIEEQIQTITKKLNRAEEQWQTCLCSARSKDDGIT